MAMLITDEDEKMIVEATSELSEVLAEVCMKFVNQYEGNFDGIAVVSAVLADFTAHTLLAAGMKEPEIHELFNVVISSILERGIVPKDITQ